MKKLGRILFMSLFLLFGAKAAFAAEELQVHFIDVGQADAALITCDGHAMLIDGGDKDDSQKIYSYLKAQNITYLDYIVATHEDADHVGGLPGAVTYVGKNIGTVFAPYTDSEKERFQTFKKKLGEYGKSITVPKAGEEYTLGSAKFKILSAGSAGNNKSIVLRIEHGKNSFLFMGDADSDQEKEIINAGYKIESTVLKVGHHGSDTSTCYQFLREVYPSYAVICVGKGNKYGHPTDAVLSRLRDQDATVYRTDNNGTVIFTSDGKKLTVKTEKTATKEKNLIPGGKEAVSSGNNNVQKETPAAGGTSEVSTYVLNTNTKKFHRPNCSSVGQMKEKNKKTVTDSRANIISQGYDPCKNCNP